MHSKNMVTAVHTPRHHIQMSRLDDIAVPYKVGLGSYCTDDLTLHIGLESQAKRML